MGDGSFRNCIFILGLTPERWLVVRQEKPMFYGC